MKKKLLFLGCMLVAGLAWAQSTAVKGKVYDRQTGELLPGVHIAMANAPIGTVSGKDGTFSLLLPVTRPMLSISCIGYESIQQAVPADSAQSLSVGLKASVIALNREVMVSAGRYETNQFQTNVAGAVLSATQLAQNTLRSTPEILMGETGVFVQKTNHGGGSPFIRGLTGQQILLMVDGIRLNNATFRSGPNQYLNTVDPLSLERVEIMRGAGSVQYGSDAIGGLVQVLTQNPDFSDQVKLSGALYGKWMSAGMEQSGRAQVQLSSRAVAVQGGFSYRNFGDMVAGGDRGKLSPTAYREAAFDGKARIRLNHNHLLTFAYQQLTQRDVPLFHRIQLENFAVSVFDPQKRQLFYGRLSGFYRQKLWQKIELTLAQQQTNEGRTNQRNGNPVRSFENDRVRTNSLIFQVFSAPAPFWTIQSGAEFYHDRVSSSRVDTNVPLGTQTARRGLYPDGATMGNLAFFTLHQFQFGKLGLASGLRYNAIQLNVPEAAIGGANINPSALVGDVSVAYQFHPQHKVIASANTAFRSPNIDDLGTLGIVDFRYEVPTNDLAPEKSLNTQLTWKAKTDRFSASVSVFHNRLRGLISRVRQGRDSVQGYQVYRKENTAQAFIRGAEAELAYQFSPRFTVLGNLAYLYGQNQTNNEPMRRIPPLHGKLAAFYTHQAFYLQAEALFASEQDRLAQGDKDDNRIAKGGTPSWQVVNLSLGYTYRQLRITGGVGNIFNELYRVHGSGVDGYGRHFWLTTRWQF